SAVASDCQPCCQVCPQGKGVVSVKVKAQATGSVVPFFQTFPVMTRLGADWVICPFRGNQVPETMGEGKEALVPRGGLVTDAPLFFCRKKLAGPGSSEMASI